MIAIEEVKKLKKEIVKEKKRMLKYLASEGLRIGYKSACYDVFRIINKITKETKQEVPYESERIY